MHARHGFYLHERRACANIPRELLNPLCISKVKAFATHEAPPGADGAGSRPVVNENIEHDYRSITIAATHFLGKQLC